MAPTSKVQRGVGATLQEKLASIQPGGITYLTREEWRYMQEHATKPRDPLLQEREKTHGSFNENAYYSQALKAVFKQARANREFRIEHHEALDMIALKLSRILSGQANFHDHWDDIAGYAKLGSEACE